MPDKFKAHIALLCVSIIFGANYWIAKSLMPVYLKPEQLVFIRITGAFLLFYVISLFLPSEKVERKDLVRIFVAGLFGTTINQFLFFKGLNLTTPVDVSIIHVSNPVFTLVFAMVLIGEKLNPMKAVGIFLGATGAVILILYRGRISLDSDTFTGNLFALLNSMGYAVYLVLIKPVMKKYKPVTVMKWVFLTGIITFTPLFFHRITTVTFSGFTPSAWVSLIYVIVATTFLGYLLMIFALKYVNASTASYYVYLQPVVAAIIALWLGLNSFSWLKALATVLIFSGAYLVSQNNEPLRQK